jgi:hypothetical protein
MASEFCLYERIINGGANVGSETTYLHLEAYRCVIPSLAAYKYFEETI